MVVVNGFWPHCMGDYGDARQLPFELKQASWHVIIRCDEPEGVSGVSLNPLSSLLGIPMCVESCFSQKNLALKVCILRVGGVKQAVKGYSFVDPRYKYCFPQTFVQKLQPFLNSLVAACEDNNEWSLRGIGARW